MTERHDKSNAMSQEMQHIIDHALALVEATSGEVDDRIQSARTALKERLEAAKGDYGDLEAQLRVKIQAADEFIHVKPYYAVGTTFVAGLLLGWFMSRK